MFTSTNQTEYIMSLIASINAQESEIVRLNNELEAAKRNLNSLKDSRKLCWHEFGHVVKGFEHEGGTCVHCGINEVYAKSNRIGCY